MPRWMSIGLALLAALPCPAPACSLCGSLTPRQTLRQDFQQAKLVSYGWIANPRLAAQGPPGTGSTEFHVVRVLKDESGLGRLQQIELPRYVPVPDPRDPPKFVVFCDLVNGKLDPSRGRAVSSPALLEYLDGVKALKNGERTQALLYFFRYLDHPDEAISADAYLEFARSTDQEIGEAAKHLSPAALRKLLENPRTPPERLGMYAFLLGGCGGAADAEFLKKQIEHPRDANASGVDGFLAGYIQLRPRQGWDLTAALLADARQPIQQRYTATRVLKFYHAWKSDQARPEILRAMKGMIVDGEVADLAVDDLRRWQLWNLTSLILAQYDKSSHAAPIIRRGILRYALCCPLPEARQFVDAVRRQDADLVRELEENLELVRTK